MLKSSYNLKKVKKWDQNVSSANFFSVYSPIKKIRVCAPLKLFREPLLYPPEYCIGRRFSLSNRVGIYIRLFR